MPARRPASMKKTLQETAIALVRLTVPCTPQLILTSLVQAPLQRTAVEGVIFPDSRLAMAVTGLKVEPGGYLLEIALLIIGFCSDPGLKYCWTTLLETGGTKLLGSKPGRLTIARIPPVRTSITTAAPALLFSLARELSIPSSRAFCSS